MKRVCVCSLVILLVVALAQASWTNASKKQREKLLELIRRLAEDDKDGVMAHKVLNLLWNLAHSDDVPVDIMDQALSAHIKILDYSCSQVPARRVTWLDLARGCQCLILFCVSSSATGQRHPEDPVDRSLYRGAPNQRQMGDPCTEADQRNL